MKLIVTIGACEALACAVLLAGSAGEEVRQVSLGDGVLRVGEIEDFFSQLGSLRGGGECHLMRRRLVHGRGLVF